MIIHLKEKIWFGKYQNKRLKDIMNDDPHYIEKMLNEHDVKLSDESNIYYQNKFGRKESKSFSGQINYGRRIISNLDAPF